MKPYGTPPKPPLGGPRFPASRNLGTTFFRYFPGPDPHVEFSPRLARLIGLASDSSRHDPESLFQAVHPGDRSRLKTLLAHPGRGRAGSGIRWINPKGGFLRGQVSVFPSRSAEGTEVVQGFVEIHSALNRRREDRTGSFSESVDEVLCESLLWSSLDLLCVTDPRARILRLNPSAEGFFGYSSRRFEGQPFVSLIHDADRDRMEAALAGLDRGSQSLDCRCACKGGVYRRVQWTSTLEPGGNAIFFLGRDVTEQAALLSELRRTRELLEKKLQTRMEELGRLTVALEKARNSTAEQEPFFDSSPAAFRGLFDSAPVGMLLVGPGRRILRANRAFRDLRGKLSSSAPGEVRLAGEVLRSGREVRRLFHTLESQGRVKGMRGRLTRDDGTEVLVRIDATRVRDRSGRFLYDELVFRELEAWELDRLAPTPARPRLPTPPSLRMLGRRPRAQ